MLSVFDVIQNPNLIHIDPREVPSVLEAKPGELRIKTKLVVPYVSEGIKMLQTNDSKTTTPTQVIRQGYVSISLIFDWDNKLNESALYQDNCIIHKTDSIAFLKIRYPSLNDYEILWYMDLASPVEKYIRKSTIMNLNTNMDVQNLSNISEDGEFHFIKYEEMLANPNQFVIPNTVKDTLRRESLIGGIIYDRRDSARLIEDIGTPEAYGDKIQKVYEGRKITTGILQKIPLFDL